MQDRYRQRDFWHQQNHQKVIRPPQEVGEIRRLITRSKPSENMPSWQQVSNTFHESLAEIDLIRVMKTVTSDGLSDKDYFLKEITFIDQANIEPLLLVAVRRNTVPEVLTDFLVKHDNDRVVVMDIQSTSSADKEIIKSSFIDKLNWITQSQTH